MDAPVGVQSSVSTGPLLHLIFLCFCSTHIKIAPILANVQSIVYNFSQPLSTIMCLAIILATFFRIGMTFDELADFRPHVELFDIQDLRHCFGADGGYYGRGGLGIDEEDPLAFDGAEPPAASAERLIADYNAVSFQQRQKFLQKPLLIHFMYRVCRALFAHLPK